MLRLLALPRAFKAYRSTDARVRFRCIQPVYPPPGRALQPPDWPVLKFMERIGMGCRDWADKFESVQQVLDARERDLERRQMPAAVRRHVMMIAERLRRGVLTFEYLERRNPAHRRTPKVSINQKYKQARKGKQIAGAEGEKKEGKG